MRHEITKTKSFLLILDDTYIKIGDWYYLPRTDSPHFCTSEEGAIELNLERYVGTRKILAHLPLEGMTLYGLDLLPSMVKIEYDVIGQPMVDYINEKHNQDECIGFIDGYKKSREKYKWTDDDMYEVYQAGIRLDGYKETIRSLSKPKIPIGFECEYQSPEDRYYEDGVGYTHNVKRINNSQGQTQWVGKYIYA